jgi:RHS repeat-associated protein
VTEETVFVYSNGRLVAEYSSAPPPTNPTVSYTITDLLGSPRVLVNAIGEVISRRDFMPFGEELPQDTTNRTAGLKYGTADTVRQKFTGYLKDDETGLDFAENRMYENRHGRFTAVDPLLASGKSANPQTFNRYVYVGNNPLFLVDRNGLIWGRADDGRVRWFAKKLGAGFKEFTPDNWQYVGRNNRVVQLDSKSSKWNYIDPVRVDAPPVNRVQELASGVERGYEDSKSGAAKGVGNFFINLWNGATDLAVNTRGGIYAPGPNPFSVERYSYTSGTEARMGVGFEVGLTVAPTAAGAPFSATSSLSVVPQEASSLSRTVTVGRWMGQADSMRCKKPEWFSKAPAALHT